MPIHYEMDDEHIVLITIDRPEAKNACDLYHFRDLASAWRRFRDDPDAWVAIVTGVGRNFMAGADLKTYIPQITDLQKRIASGEVDEIDGCKLRDGFFAADSRAFLIAEIFDLPLDQVKRIDAPHRFVRRRGLFALRIGQGFERLEEASPRMGKTTDVKQAGEKVKDAGKSLKP